MVRVFINGYGNIGRRLASAFSHDKEIQFVGIGKYSIDNKVDEAFSKKFPVYVPEEKVQEFKGKGYDISGTISDAIKESDLVIDAAKDGFGYSNKVNFYIPLNKPAIFQGGEDRTGEKKVADIIHNSRINYDKVSNQKYVIQGSCNVSGMGRIMQPMIEKFGDKIQRYDVTLIRRWADLEDKKEVKDSIEWDKNPHHQDDVKSFLPSVKLYVEAYKVPSRMMHLHQMIIRFKDKVPNFDSMSDIYHDEFGVAVLANAKGTADIRLKARELGFEHDDTNMVHIHEETMRKSDDTLKILYSDDQTGIVIPENHLLFQSMALGKSKKQAYEHTDSLFQISKKRDLLVKQFG
ncbi:MAG: type II glyceraldehyde-3-phosphate dehydrogenase [Nitrososphaeraceae archaeon]|nr:type II glyceraldehyde-3-phosphate dehydrogenase [Nitrososphaeraceae archaeon]MDW0205972.1 type II glyceraldehyde-3-phosphate dehydrogenase [Nitrososphaeraceae archaeon]MDW0219564.1 type II glyceraldehyde-3-phosphate dehydrogenase [Nitrososphaeraceae archaeon]MDW0233512.1 type II glyceraldehyde-3-phosphate dehydrogenase [Nitrososphaeraceae archaeon]MDW0300477.1 type II glyceraldehyde-3-phosphate dehydrogenase [Nitrososphaeraceae archaeon]